MMNIYPSSPRGRGFVLPSQMCSAHPTLNKQSQRKQAIINNDKAVFVVADNMGADASEVFFELCSAHTVKQFSSIIRIEAYKHDVDTNLIKAIMFMETSHGWYDKINPWRETILPMNVHYKFWENLGVTKEKLLKPEFNIHIGALILKRIQDRIKDPKIAKIASIYNFTGSEVISDYGARVAMIYREKAWEKC